MNQGGNYWTLFTPGIWKVLHAVFHSLCAAVKITLLSINAQHVLTLVDPEPPTRDPFDRLLLAQCEMEGLRLVTIDCALVSHRLAAG
jgi:PIN domain nuclease of toxin-antitoxin system